MLSVLTLALLGIPTIYEIISDVKEWRKDVRDKKTQDVIIRAVMVSVVALFNCLFVDSDSTFWQSSLLSFGIFVMFFDYFMGMYLTKNPFFLGTTSQTDMFWKVLPWYMGISLRGTVFAITIIIYKYWSFIEFIISYI